MKAPIIVIAIGVLAGAMLGTGLTWANFGGTPPFVDRDATVPKSTVTAQGKRPKLVVNHRGHDFGAVDRDVKAVHSFQITNVGDAPLTLEAGQTTCSRCTIATLTKPVVEPGETAEVTIEYSPTIGKPRFRQTALVLTNDPDEPRVELDIFGHVTTRYELTPHDFAFSKVSVNQSKTIEIKLQSFLSNEIHLVRHEFLEAATVDKFEFACEPLSTDELTNPDARGGCRLLLTVKPGLPLGQILQTIRVELAFGGDHKNAVIELPIEGQVVSDISVVNRDWYAHLSQLRMGVVKSSQGAKRQLLIVVRGPHRHDVSLKPIKIEPDWVRVTVGEPVELNKKGPADNGVTQIPLTIEIPANAPPANHLGSGQGKLGEVILETNHPDVKQLPIYLHFAVEQ
jgi:hypothetical protein